MINLSLNLDWEQKIIDICKKYQIDIDAYNGNDEIKENVAHILGFSNFQSFQAFPNPKSIIGGMALPFKSEYIGFAPALLDDCCKEIERHWQFNKNEEARIKHIDNFIDYVFENNFAFELIVYTAKLLMVIYKFPINDAKNWSKLYNQIESAQIVL